MRELTRLVVNQLILNQLTNAVVIEGGTAGTLEKLNAPVKFVFNIKGKLRKDKLEGREHLVAPMVMIVEGVWNGSNGPLLYPAEELSKTPEVWNMKPVVVNHPQKDGVGVTATSPEMINQSKIGLVMNTKWDEKTGKLTAEAWLEVERVKEVDQRILNKLNKGEVVELSTGLFSDYEAKEGEFRGKKYTAIARNYRPDHLAILPDNVGACSTLDGAGLLRNEASFDATRDLIQKELREVQGSDYGYVVDVFRNYFIYAQRNYLYKQSYSATDTSVTLVGNPTEVVRVVTYQTEDGLMIGNKFSSRRLCENLNQDKENDGMNKAALIALLIANSAGLWTETDKPYLETRDEKWLTGLTDNLKITSNGKPVAPPVVKPEEKPVVTANTVEPKKVLTLQDLPMELQEIVATGLQANQREKGILIKKITANSRNVFTEEMLNAKKLPELQAIAALAQGEDKSSPFSFAGLGDLLTGNSQQETETPLGVPTFQVDKK